MTSVDVTLDLIADQVYREFGWLEEYFGYVVFSAFDDDLTLKVPFYFVPRPYAELTEVLRGTNLKFTVIMARWISVRPDQPLQASGPIL